MARDMMLVTMAHGAVVTVGGEEVQWAINQVPITQFLAKTIPSPTKASSSTIELTINKRDDLSGPSTNIPQSRSGTLEHRGSSGGGAGEALRSLRCSLSSLGSSFRGGRGVSDRGPPGEELRLPQDGTRGRDRHSECDWQKKKEKTLRELGTVQQSPMGNKSRARHRNTAHLQDQNLSEI